MISLSLLGETAPAIPVKTAFPFPGTKYAITQPEAGLVPGAGVLPVSVRSSFTIKNVLIGAMIVVGSYFVYSFLRPKKKALAPAISGLFGRRRKRRR